MTKNVALAAILAAFAGAALAGETGIEGAAQEHEAQSGDLQALDADMDGAVSEQEAQGNPQLVVRWDELDTNNDGQLDQDEFARFEAEGTQSEGAESAGETTSQ